EDDLLRVPAGQVADGLVWALGLDVEVPDHLYGSRAASGGWDGAEPAQLARDRHRPVLAHRQQRHEALVVAVLGDEAEPGGERGRDVAGPDRPALDGDLAGVGPAQADQGLGERHLAAAA